MLTHRMIFSLFAGQGSSFVSCKKFLPTEEIEKTEKSKVYLQFNESGNLLAQSGMYGFLQAFFISKETPAAERR
jgi:hypothetical protein